MAADLVLDSLDTDILVLGAGGAGLCAALHAADRSPRLTVTVAVKGLLGRAGCARMVEGGFNAVLEAPDSIEAHLVVSFFVSSRRRHTRWSRDLSSDVCSSD